MISNCITWVNFPSRPASVMGLNLQYSEVYDCVWVPGTCLEVSDLTEPKAVQKTQLWTDLGEQLIVPVGLGQGLI